MNPTNTQAKKKAHTHRRDEVGLEEGDVLLVGEALAVLGRVVLRVVDAAAMVAPQELRHLDGHRLLPRRHLAGAEQRVEGLVVREVLADEEALVCGQKGGGGGSEGR